MNELEKKDKILIYLNLEENRTTYFLFNDLNKFVFTDGSVNNNEMLYLLNSLVEDDYLLKDASQFKYISTITPFLKNGGYVGVESRRKAKEEATYQKTLYEAKLAKWQVKIFWPAFIIMLIGSILGAISFFMQVRK